MDKLKKIFISLVLICSALLSLGQVNTSQDTMREFEIIKGPSMRAIKIDSGTILQTIAGGAIIQQGTTIFHGDSITMNQQTHLVEAFGNIHINQADTIQTYGDYLRYQGDEKLAFLKGHVRLLGKKGNLHTEELDYNLGTGIANYYKGGRVVSGKDIITSREGTYFADTRDVIFKKSVVLNGTKNHVRADSLLYNMENGNTTFISQSYIKNKDAEIETTRGQYDMKTGNAIFTARTIIRDSTGRIFAADHIAMEGKTKNAQMEGNAIIIDTTNSFVIIGNEVFLNQENNSFLATRKPLLIVIDKEKHDSTYIAADIIFSGISTVLDQQLLLQKDTSVHVHPVLTGQDSILMKMDTTLTPEGIKNIPDTTNLINTQDSLYMPNLVRSDTLLLNADSLHKFMDSANVRMPVDSFAVPPSDTSEISPERQDSVHKAVDKPPLIRSDSLRIQTDSLTLFEDSSKVIMPSDTIPAISEDTLKVPMLPGDSLSKDSLPSLPADTLAIRDSTVLGDSSLLASKDSTAKDSIRYFIAYHNVRIYNDSLQSVADSLFFSTADSVFRLFRDPVLWSGETQVSGDTMYLFTEEKKPKRLFVFDRSFIVSKTKEGFYNQMSGKTINAYFKDGKFDYMRLKGSQAESIYFLQNDDSAYIGMDRATADAIDFFFEKDELNKVKFINEVNGEMYPMRQIPADKTRLKGFEWLDSRRPKSKWELFE